MMVTHNPLHGSGQAALPHPALALGGDGKPLAWIGVAESGYRKPPRDVLREAAPRHSTHLAAAREHPSPGPSDCLTEGAERGAVPRHAVVTEVSRNNRPQVGTHLRDGVVQASFQFGSHRLNLCLPPFPHRLPQHREPSLPGLPADVHVVQKRRELLLPILSCCLPYPLKSAWHTIPTLCSERVALGRISLGQSPSLHHLRSRLPGLVRRLPRYYGAVRLPGAVRHRRSPWAFTMRSAAPIAADNAGISRFPYKLIPCVRGVSDRAGSGRASRYRHVRCCLPFFSRTSAPRSVRSLRCGSYISRLNTQPARTPADASPSPLRTTTHGSEPVQFATLSLLDFFIPFNLPV